MPAADRGAFQDMLLRVKKCSTDGLDGSTLNFVESAKKSVRVHNVFSYAMLFCAEKLEAST